MNSKSRFSLRHAGPAVSLAVLESPGQDPLVRPWRTGEPGPQLVLTDWLASCAKEAREPLLLVAGGSLLAGDWGDEQLEQARQESGLVLPPDLALALEQAGGSWKPLGLVLQDLSGPGVCAAYLAAGLLTLAGPEGGFVSVPASEPHPDGLQGRWTLVRLVLQQLFDEDPPRTLRLFSADSSLRAGLLSCLEPEPRTLPLRLGGNAYSAALGAVRQGWQGVHPAYRWGAGLGLAALVTLSAPALLALSEQDDSALFSAQQPSALGLQPVADPRSAVGLLDRLGREAAVRSISLGRVELQLDGPTSAVLRIWPESVTAAQGASPAVPVLGNAAPTAPQAAPNALSDQLDALLRTLPDVTGEGDPASVAEDPQGRERRFQLAVPVPPAEGQQAWFSELEALARREGVQLPPVALDGRVVEGSAQPAAQQVRWLLASLPILQAQGLEWVRLEQPAPSEGLPLGLARISWRLAP